MFQVPLKKEKYDIVIVGGGLSGLSAAYWLENYSVLILEKEDRLDGRVNTIFINDTPVELGALFTVSTLPFPFEFDKPQIIIEQGPIGFYYTNETIYGNSTDNVIGKLNLSQDVMNEIDNFEKGLIDADDLNETSYDILNSFFKLIFPGEINEFIPKIQRMSLYTYELDHFETGNSIIINEFTKRIKAKISLNSMVISVEDLGDEVKIKYIKNGNVFEVYARACIVATPGNVAYWIVKKQSEKCKYFLENLKYGQIRSVVYLIKANKTKEFRYIVGKNTTFNSIYRCTNPSGVDTLYVYYVGSACENTTIYSDAQVIDMTFNELVQMNIGNFTKSDIIYNTTKRWSIAGAIISPEIYGNWSVEYLRPSDRVFLAGDYTYLQKPYGMYGAMMAGEYSAKNVSLYLNLDV
ncbi:MAG: FAD-dependent oxidoreductase [Candidatus Helarchaeota archaeon]